jgi:GR25 family glycosyltransferase involved in LPS biosynthesis
VQIFNAVNGREEQHYEKYMEYFNKPINNNSHPLELQRGEKIISSAGAWGYLLTWANIIKDAIDKKYDKILIFDDDVIFIKDFHACFEKCIKIFPKDWKVILLGATQNINTRTEIMNGYFLPNITDGSFAVCLSKEVFPILLGEIKKMNAPLDSGALRHVYEAFKGKCFVLYPHLVIADVTESDIRGGRDMVDFAQKMDWDLTLYDTGKKDIVYVDSKCNPDFIKTLNEIFKVIIVNDNKKSGIYITSEKDFIHKLKYYQLYECDKLKYTLLDKLTLLK